MMHELHATLWIRWSVGTLGEGKTVRRPLKLLCQDDRVLLSRKTGVCVAFGLKSQTIGS